MNFDDYQHLALKTEAPITAEIRARYIECSRILFEMLEGYLEYQWADPVKKYIFYGKGDSELFHLLAVSNDTPVTDLPHDDRTIRLVHGWLGVASEVPELGAAILNQDFANVAEESGDFKWYGAVIDDALEMPSSVVAAANIQKLATRYPEKFSEEKALNRDLVQERESLSDFLLTE